MTIRDAFHLILVVRVRLMKNRSSSLKKRTFLNFFVVDPEKPIPTTLNITTGEDLWKIFLSFAKDNDLQMMPRDVFKMITSELNMFSCLEEAKEFRAKARDAMLSTKSGWGYLHFGNYGIQRFYRTKELQDEGSESLNHTSSKTASE